MCSDYQAAFSDQFVMDVFLHGLNTLKAEMILTDTTKPFMLVIQPFDELFRIKGNS